QSVVGERSSQESQTYDRTTGKGLFGMSVCSVHHRFASYGATGPVFLNEDKNSCNAESRKDLGEQWCARSIFISRARRPQLESSQRLSRHYDSPCDCLSEPFASLEPKALLFIR
ncbi:unnamed protein product, partial [Cyprideis torosa]